MSTFGQQYELMRARMRAQHLHFVGIGGAGMSGIAEVYKNIGYTVTGSDMKASKVTARLEGMEIGVTIGHSAENVADADVVVVSTAVQADNPEVVAAHANRTPVVPRAEMLAELMRFAMGIAVAGTHGKTTTTSLVASILAAGDLDPTFVIGGLLNSAGTNARLGTGQILVAEADESDASFLYLQPMMAIVTNIDQDHMSTYQGDYKQLRQTFIDFLHHLPFYGLAIMCIDDDNIRDVLPEVGRPVRTYGVGDDAEVRASDIRSNGLQTVFTVTTPKHPAGFVVTLNMPGHHNVLNALAAIAIADELDVSTLAMQSALEAFSGVGRRFQVHGDLSMPEGKVTLVDDYGHHPRELEPTLAAARAAYPGRRIVLAFQPHRFSRTRDLFEDFVDVLSEADALLISEVFAAGEDPIATADGRALCRAIRARGQSEPVFAKDPDELIELLPGIVKDGDVLITAGAGSIGQVPAKLVTAWKAS